MSCKFIRQAKGGYEYGHIEITNNGASNEKRTHIVQGTADTAIEAMSANDMALSDTRNIRRHIEPHFLD